MRFCLLGGLSNTKMIEKDCVMQVCVSQGGKIIGVASYLSHRALMNWCGKAPTLRKHKKYSRHCGDEDAKLIRLSRITQSPEGYQKISSC